MRISNQELHEKENWHFNAIDLDKVGLANWQAICHRIANSKITKLRFSSCHLNQLSMIRFQHLFNMIRAANLSSLHITDDSLGKLDPKSWQIFCNAIKGAKLTALTLSKASLAELDNHQWQVFVKALAESKITRLRLIGNQLGRMNPANWRALCSGLQISQVGCLDLSFNDLDRLNAASWSELHLALQASRIISFAISEPFNLMQINNHPAGWVALCALLKAPKLISLDLGIPYLIDPVNWTVFCATLQASKITSLKLWNNFFSHVHPLAWRGFCEAIQASHITFLNLEQNILKQLDIYCWQTLCTAIQGANLLVLDLSKNQLEDFSEVHWQILAVAIQDKLLLEIAGLPQSIPVELKKILERNALLKKALANANMLANQQANPNQTKQEILTAINEIIANISQALLSISGKKTNESLDVNMRLRSHYNSLLWLKGQTLRELALDSNDAMEPQSLINNMIDTWTAISIESDHYEQAHFELFQFSYTTTFEETKDSFHAVIAALPYLLNSDKTLIKLRNDYLKVFDAYLFAAAGGKKGGLQKKLKPEERLAILQYIALSAVRQSYQKTKYARTSKINFFLSKTPTNFDCLHKQLFLDPNRLSEDSIRNLNALWTKITTLTDFSVEDGQQALISAITHLTDSIYSQRSEGGMLGKRTRAA